MPSRSNSFGQFANNIWFKATCLVVLLIACVPSPSSAQQLTQEPGAWRPVSYADLRVVTPTTATYADIWKDAIEENNRAYLDRGDRRFAGGNAPATEAHFVIWSPAKSVVVSTLNTATGCALKELRSAARATVKLCPMRIAFYEGILVRTMDGGRACFLELEPSSPTMTPDPNNAVSYAAYDVATKTVKTGLILDHRPIDGCSNNIPLYPP